MPFSDRPPQFVFPDTEQGRRERAEFVKEEFETLSQVVVLCDRYQEQVHPVFTDDDVYRASALRPCANRNREGVRDMNWCLRCAAGLPHHFLSERDSEGLRDFHTMSGF
jgi:hypothetical protein